MDTRTSPARLHIERIREVLQANGCAAALILSSDPHLSEYLPERWQGRQWASGFTGSVATLVVTATRAALFADSRYWVQAERELAGSGIELVKVPTPASAQHVDWLCEHVARGATVAVDGSVLGLGAARHLQETLATCGIALRSDLDLVADAWPDRPELPSSPVFEHVGAEAPLTRTDKLAAALAALPAGAALLVDPKRTTFGLVERSRARRVEAINPSTLAKSRKSEAEAAHVRQAMIEDGIAMCEFYAEFEDALADVTRSEPITELTIDTRLTEARARRPGYVGPSFATIAAFNGNGAMPH